MKEFRANDIIRLLETQSYREFMRVLIQNESKKRNKNFNQSGFARKAGISSRSFLSEVLNGKKHLTNFSLPRVVKAFGISGHLARYFELMVSLEEPKVNYLRLSKEQTHVKLETLKEKIRSRVLSYDVQSKAINVYSNYEVLRVYCSLGEKRSGREISEISKISKVSKDVCELVVEKLCKMGVANKVGSRFENTERHLMFSDLGSSESFKEIWLNTHREVSEKALKSFDDPSSYFFASVYSTSVRRFPELKKKLHEVMLDFCSSEQDDNGENLIAISLGMSIL